MIKFLIAAFLIITSLNAMKKDVTVSILPQKYFVEKISGDKINVNVMVKPGFSPATYEPKTSQMRRLADSKIYFSIGVPFENTWLEKFKNANKEMLIVDTTKGIEKIAMAAHSHHDDHDEHEEDKKHDDHEEDKKHDDHEGHEDHKKHDDHDDHEGHEDHKKHDDDDDHEGLDPHVWLDPILVKIQAKNIYLALVKIDKENENVYKSNYENFVKELDDLDHKIEHILEPYKNKAFMVFHPSWGYFAKRYFLEQVSIETEGKEPKPNELIKLIKEAKEEKVKIVFVAAQFSQKSAKIIANSINGDVVVINPLPANWSKNLIETAEQIAKSYK